MRPRTPILIAGLALLAGAMLLGWPGRDDRPQGDPGDAATGLVRAGETRGLGAGTGTEAQGSEREQRPADDEGAGARTALDAQSPAEPAFEQFTIRGRLVDRRGLGLGGNTLRFGEGDSVAESTTDGDGSFELVSRWRPRSELRVAASAPLQLVDGDRLLRSVVIDRQSALTLVAVRAATLEGSVQDRAGRPVAGAVIVGFGPDLNHRLLCWSDAEGRFAARAVVVLERPLSVQAWTRDMAVSQAVAVELAEGGRRGLTLVLRSPASLSGRVLGPGDKPVAGVLVRLQPAEPSCVPGGMGSFLVQESASPSERPDGAWDGRFEESPYATRSDRDGNFGFAALPAAVYGLRWGQDIPRILEPVTDGQPPTLRLAEGEHREGFVLRLREPGDPAWQIHGRVLDPAGKPVAGTAVFGVPAEHPPDPADIGRMTAMATCDAEGRFVLQPKDDRALRLSVAWVSRPLPSSWRRPKPQEVAVGSRDVELCFRLGKGATLRGRFVAPPGETLPAVIQAALAGPPVLPIRVGPDGRFELRDVPPGRFRLEWRQDGLMFPAHQVEVTDEGERDLGELQVVALGWIEGRAVDGSGQALTGVAVVLDRGYFPGLEQRDAMITARTGDEGRFRVRGLRPDGTVFVLAKAGFAPIQRVLRTEAECRMRDWRMVPVTRLRLRGLPGGKDHEVWPAMPGQPAKGAVRIVPSGPAVTYGDAADEGFLRGRTQNYALEAGVMSFDHVAVGAWRVELLGLRGGKQVVLARRDIRLEAGAERWLDWD